MNRELKVLYSAQFVNALADYLLIPIFALLVIQISTKVQLVGVLFAIQYLTSSVVSLFVIRMKDQSHLDEYLLKLNYFIKGFGWLFLIFFQTVPMLIFVEILIGIASGIGSPSFSSLISEHLDKNKHLAEWGDSILIQNLAIGLGSLLAGYILASHGFTAIFIAMTIFEFASFFICHYALQKRYSR
ncbi:hypothetical protein A3G67_00075 [Candidatus Roizmanbacteria bacterium RIFCSPLOWO2_12_FULL_40_12]|nr:MAG: hypothetical protein A2779_02240 [Candidatus Roizmanbacteria bacterium RIFCSPHIGHO2_01_FULL_40_98]OGK29886.1 MAG: hypothetical protein A2W49_04335 [Candidatus Roizmanbacteria bacterium RIFCSPHIGHO2_12_41_18]OGK36749.1 MAG: hypothetical protein A3E69_03360 [Candidatus Roizmanbacteria bacterium RIFCSPHIGHO2_12_FULL_40_130]OGK58855.1 MAG: hypothetical protein A3H84_05060 [Candidatus Roizmanbacteria bacterium RIFCSPLOWO2_02_FULL_40_13]OGK60472.1 MAG: hypothetical protein A3G67_00075 [Candid